MRIQQLTQGHVLSAQCCTSLGAAAVVLQHIHRGAKALELPAPVAQSAEGADDEEGAVHATAAQVAQEGDGLDLQGGDRRGKAGSQGKVTSNTVISCPNAVRRPCSCPATNVEVQIPLLSQPCIRAACWAPLVFHPSCGFSHPAIGVDHPSKQ